MKLVNYILFLVYCVGLYLYEAATMFPVETSIKLSVLFPLLVLFSSIVICFFQRTRAVFNLRQFSVFFTVTYILTLLHTFSNPLSSGINYITLLLPIVNVKFSYKILQGNLNAKAFDFGMLVVFILLTYFYFDNYQNNTLITLDYQNNAAYTLLFFSPILLCSNNKYVRYGVLFITGIAIIFSLKRSGIVAYVLALLVYVFVNIFVSKNNVSRYSVLLLSIIGVFVCFEFFNTYFGERTDLLVERFVQLDHGDSSGRDEIFWDTFAMIKDSSLFYLIFGHGYNSLARLSTFKLSAHNDYLEFMFDYGIIGLSMLLSYMILFCKYVYSLIMAKSHYAAPATFALVIIIINSCFSHVFFYEWYLLLVSVFWGYLNYAVENETC